MKFNTPYEYDDSVRGEHNNAPSLTIPDNSLTIREILDRYSKGLPTGGTLDPIYDDSDDIDFDTPDVRNFDLSDLDENKLRIQQLKEYSKQLEYEKQKLELEKSKENDAHKALESK